MNLALRFYELIRVSMLINRMFDQRIDNAHGMQIHSKYASFSVHMECYYKR